VLVAWGAASSFNFVDDGLPPTLQFDALVIFRKNIEFVFYHLTKLKFGGTHK